MKTAFLTALLILGVSATAETYKVDTQASSIQWKGGKKIGSFHNGDVKIKSGTVETDAKGQVKSASVVADMKTITDEDLKSNPEYQKKLVTHLSSEDFFNVEKYPEATFALTSIEPVKGSKDDYTVKGKLTMIGKTEDVEFPAKITADKKAVSGTGTVKIERLKWGLQYGSGSIFKKLTADKVINDYFELTLNIIAKK